jgi:hypothetical protein
MSGAREVRKKERMVSTRRHSWFFSLTISSRRASRRTSYGGFSDRKRKEIFKKFLIYLWVVRRRVSTRIIELWLQFISDPLDVS